MVEGDEPLEPLSAWESELGPGPGTELPEAPARGSPLDWTYCWPWLCDVEGPAVGEEPTIGVAASLAVLVARDGEPPAKLWASASRKLPDGMDRALEDSDMLLQLFDDTRPTGFLGVDEGEI